MLCGRYEGVDERVRGALATEELSIGDYVLSGGELPALVIVDAVARLVPGVVGDEAVGGARYVRARAARLPAVHAPGGVSRDARSRMCCYRGITRRSSDGGGVKRWRERWSVGRSCWRRRDARCGRAGDAARVGELNEEAARTSA